MTSVSLTSGRLQEETLSELLHALGERAATGALVLKRRGELAIVYLRDGKVIGTVLPTTSPAASPVGARHGLRDQVRSLAHWDDGEYRFHHLLAPQRPALEVGISIDALLADDTAVESEEVDPGALAPPLDEADHHQESAICDLIGRFRTFLLWSTLRYPSQPLMGITDGLEQCINRLVAQHRVFHLDHPDLANPTDHQDLRLGRLISAVRMEYPALEAAQISDGGIDGSDLKATYTLISGPARDAFYQEVASGLLALGGRVLDELLACEVSDPRSAEPCRRAWASFRVHADDRIGAVLR